MQVLLGIASAILFLINCSAFILYGVTALFGPIFVPLLMTKTFRAKFFHFLDVLIGFAMIRAVAAAFIFVWAGFMNAFIQQTFNGNYSMEMWLANLIPCTMVFIAFIINMLFIPSMTQAIFGGAAGMAGSMRKRHRQGRFDCCAWQEEHNACSVLVGILMLRRLDLGRPFAYTLCWCCCSAALIAGSDLHLCRIPRSRRKEPCSPCPHAPYPLKQR